MESILNELSVENMAETPAEVRAKMIGLLKLCNELQVYKFSKLRLPNDGFFETELTKNYTLNNWINDHQVKQIYKTLFLGLQVRPFFEELKTESQDLFIASKFLLHEEEHTKFENEVEGLADAFLRDTLCVSFPSHSVWEKCEINLKIIAEENNENQKLVKVKHTSGKECPTTSFQNWIKQKNRPPLNSHTDVDIWFPEDNYQLTNKAKDNLIFIYQNNQHHFIGEIENLIEEIWIDPMKGTGKPETLKGDFKGWMSRRIDQKHRLVYQIDGDILKIYSCLNHYDDR